MDFVSRLRTFMTSQSITNSQFADTCGIPRPTLSQILTGRNKKISDELVSKIHSAYPWLNILWLLFGEGDMTNDTDTQTSAPQIEPKTDETEVYTSVNEGIEADKVTDDRSIDFGSDNLSDGNNLFTGYKPAVDTPSDMSGGFGTDPESATAGPTVVDKTANDTLSTRLSDLSSEDAERVMNIPRHTGTAGTASSKRITNIVVFYDDSSFESFLPSNLTSD